MSRILLIGLLGLAACGAQPNSAVNTTTATETPIPLWERSTINPADAMIAPIQNGVNIVSNAHRNGDPEFQILETLPDEISVCNGSYVIILGGPTAFLLNPRVSLPNGTFHLDNNCTVLITNVEGN